MGCKLVRGETIYFIRHAGRTSGAEWEADWFRDETDRRLLPAVYVRSDGHSSSAASAAAFPVEIRTFDS
jgi:hypothetical protein